MNFFNDGMTVSEHQLLVRFFKLGSLLALFASLHILTLLLPWYVVRADTVSATVLSGYLTLDTLFLSSTGGVVAGVSLLATSFSNKAGTVRAILAALSLLGGFLSLTSPLYMNLVIIPRLNITGEPQPGFFAAIFSAIVVIAIGVVVILTRPKRVEVPYTGYEGYEPGYTSRSATVTEQTSFESVANVEEGIICPICYTTVMAENAVRCTSCGVIFHSGCVDAYVNINGTCPNCGRAVV